MDPVTLVVSALVAGLLSGTTDTAKAAVKDAYESLKLRLLHKAEDKEEAKEAIAGLERKPESPARQAMLKEELAGLDIDKDEALLDAAKALLEQSDPEGSRQGKYNITIINSSGIVIGDRAKVNQRSVTKNP